MYSKINLRFFFLDKFFFVKCYSMYFFFIYMEIRVDNGDKVIFENIIYMF